MLRTSSLLALGFWLWSAFIAIGAGFLGTVLNCEGGEGCSDGWLRGGHASYTRAVRWLAVTVCPRGFRLLG